MENYLNRSNYSLLSKLPIIIVINGRGFSKSTQLLTKPFDSAFDQCMTSTMLQLCLQVEGATFAYHINDEIILMARNDQTNDTACWYNGHIQKIASITSSIATLHFNECVSKLQLNMTGDCLFTSQVFEVPNIAEGINAFIYKQQQNAYLSIQSACLYSLLTKHNKDTIKEMLAGLTNDEKIDLLWQECQINFNDYPLAFKRGSAAYKVPKLIDGAMKNKWHLNDELPIFTKSQSFLQNIFRMGSDIFGQEDIE